MQREKKVFSRMNPFLLNIFFKEITRSYKSLESFKLITIGKKLTFAYKVVKTHSYSIIYDAAIAKQVLPPSQASFQAQMQAKQLVLPLNFQIIEEKKDMNKNYNYNYSST